MLLLLSLLLKLRLNLLLHLSLNLRLNLRLLLLLLLRSLLSLLLGGLLGLLSSCGGKVHLLHSAPTRGHHHRLLLLLLTLLLKLLLLIWMRSGGNLNRLPVDGRRADNVRMMGTRRSQLESLRPSRTTAHSRWRPRGDNGRLDVPTGRISDLNRLNLPGLVVMERRCGNLYRLRRSRWVVTRLTTSRLDHLQPLRRLEGQLRGHSHRLLLLLLLLELHLLLLLLLLLKLLLLLLLLLDINRRLSLAAGDVVPKKDKSFSKKTQKISKSSYLDRFSGSITFATAF